MKKQNCKKIYDRVRAKQLVYILNRNSYNQPPTLKRLKVVSKTYIDFGYEKAYYLTCGNGLKIEMGYDREVYTSQKEARLNYINTYKTHIQKRAQYLNKIKSEIVSTQKEITAKKYNIKKLKRKYKI